MPGVHFTNLLIVVAAGLLAPLVLGFFPRVRLPAIVLEIVLGIVIGPSGFGWVKPDLPVSILALVGLAFLLFLSGLEIDLERVRGRILRWADSGMCRQVRLIGPPSCGHGRRCLWGCVLG
jgi:Kef-type K+ transport system membrane component KefB